MQLGAANKLDGVGRGGGIGKRTIFYSDFELIAVFARLYLRILKIQRIADLTAVPYRIMDLLWVFIRMCVCVCGGGGHRPTDNKLFGFQINRGCCQICGS